LILVEWFAFTVVYSIQHYVIKFVSDLWQVGGFPLGLRFPSKMAWVIVMQIQVVRQCRPQGLWLQRHCGPKFSLRSAAMVKMFLKSPEIPGMEFICFAWWSIVIWDEAKPMSLIYIYIYSKTCLNQTPLGLKNLFSLDRRLVYTGSNYIDIQ
jgi:hypothetical protein